jgi:hypothetical protein
MAAMGKKKSELRVILMVKRGFENMIADPQGPV